MPVSTLAGYESGRRAVTVQELGRLLEVAGLELALAERLPEASTELRWHLRASLTQRLYGGVEPSGSLPGPGARWRQLWALASRHRVEVVGDAATAVWLPRGAADRVQVVVDVGAVGDAAVVPESVLALAPDLDVRPATGALATVPVPWLGWRVLVGSPGELAVTASSPVTATELRVAARLLHEQSATDELDRRAPAHRDPAHALERERTRQTRRYGSLPIPDAHQLRSWRLRAPVGYLAWLGSLGYPESGDRRRTARPQTGAPG